MIEKRISERELILPTLFLIDLRGRITTSDLIKGLTDLLKPTGEDIVILKGRKDTKFSQKVRNLVSHETLTKLRYVSYKSLPNNGLFIITEAGKDYLENNREVVEYLLSNNFHYDDVKKSLGKVSETIVKKKRILIYEENLMITEGVKRSRNTSLYERSRLLRDFAIKKFTKNKHIKCSACFFDFYDVYGDVGSGLIEIHHLKPVFQYGDKGKMVFLKEALKSVAPVCSNCHRIIHRKKQQPLSVEEVRTLIRIRHHEKRTRTRTDQVTLGDRKK